MCIFVIYSDSVVISIVSKCDFKLVIPCQRASTYLREICRSVLYIWLRLELNNPFWCHVMLNCSALIVCDNKKDLYIQSKHL